MTSEYIIINDGARLQRYLALASDGKEGDHGEAGHPRDEADRTEVDAEALNLLHDSLLVSGLGGLPESIQGGPEVGHEQRHHAKFQEKCAETDRGNM